MKSDVNSFCGEVVLDSFNMVYRDEDSILYQICEEKNILDFIILKGNCRKCISKELRHALQKVTYKIGF